MDCVKLFDPVNVLLFGRIEDVVPIDSHVQGGNPEQAWIVLSLRLKYCPPVFAPVTSESVYAVAPTASSVKFTTTAGGTAVLVRLCVVPLIVRGIV
jgi:hypothetical protein